MSPDKHASALFSVQGQILLAGMDVKPSEDSDGRVLEMEFLWEAKEKTSSYCLMFLQLYREGVLVPGYQYGRIIGRALYPTFLWESGDRITERYNFPLPKHLKSGQYEIVTFFFNPEMLFYLPIDDGATQQDRITLMRFFVDPHTHAIQIQ
jgi:hypothetical protein